MEPNTFEFHWNMLIVFYLFTAGVSAGAFFVSGLATYPVDGRFTFLPLKNIITNTCTCAQVQV